MSKKPHPMLAWEKWQLENNIHHYTVQLILGQGEPKYYAEMDEKQMAFECADTWDRLHSKFGRQSMVHAITREGRSIIIPREKTNAS